VSAPLVDLADALVGVEDGMTVMVGGWGEAGSPSRLIGALATSGRRGLTVISAGTATMEPLNGAGVVAHHITSFGSYPGRFGAASAFERRLAAGELTVELCSQGILAERIRAGGAGIPAFYVPQRMVGAFTSGGEQHVIAGEPCVLETALRADVALIGASRADLAGNLTWPNGERNLNEVMAFAADLVVAEVAELTDVGGIPPEAVMVPGFVVDRLVAA
jgi:3-oxoacid CoA-transferase A subunit